MRFCKVVSTVPALTRRAVKELSGVESVMSGVAQDAADHLVATDPYQNRTGDLRASTVSESIDLGDAVEVTIAMGMPYASHVIRRGFSGWEEAVADAERDMDRAISAIATRISRSF
jgi:hypothetical protein